MTIAANIPKIYADRFVAQLWLIGPALVAFYQANGLDATQVFLIQAIFNIWMFALEVPTGYVSDLIGRRRAMIFSALLIPIGLGIYAAAQGFTSIITAELVIGIGLSLRSGTDSALLYDTLRELNREKDYLRYAGNGQFLESAGHAVSALLGGLLSAIALRLPFYVNTATALLLLPISLMIKEPQRAEKPQHPHVRDMGHTILFCARHAEIRPIVLLGALLNGIHLVAFWSYVLVYQALHIPLGVYGVIIAAFGILAGVGGKCAHKVAAKIGYIRAFALGLLPGFGFLALSWIHNEAALPLILAIGFFWGYAQPLVTQGINAKTASDLRATTLSVATMMGRLTCAGFGLLAQQLTQHIGLSFTHRVFGGAILLLGLPCLLALNRAQNPKLGAKT